MHVECESPCVTSLAFVLQPNEYLQANCHNISSREGGGGREEGGGRREEGGGIAHGVGAVDDESVCDCGSALAAPGADASTQVPGDAEIT